MGQEHLDQWLELSKDLMVEEATQIMNVVASGLEENPYSETVKTFIWLTNRMDKAEIMQGLAALGRLVPRPKTKFVQFIDLARELPSEDIDRMLAALDRRRPTKLEQFIELARELHPENIDRGLAMADRRRKTKEEQFIDLARELSVEDIDRELTALTRRRKSKVKQFIGLASEVRKTDLEQFTDLAKGLSYNDIIAGLNAAGPGKSLFPIAYDLACQMLNKLTEKSPHLRKLQELEREAEIDAEIKRQLAHHRNKAWLDANPDAKESKNRYKRDKWYKLNPEEKKQRKKQATRSISATLGSSRSAAPQSPEPGTPRLGFFSVNSLGPNSVATTTQTGQPVSPPHDYQAAMERGLGMNGGIEGEEYDEGETTEEVECDEGDTNEEVECDEGDTDEEEDFGGDQMEMEQVEKD